MDRQIFLEGLRSALHGKISDNDLAEHMRYYESYIAQEMSKGQSEQKLLEELGDPRLIAKTILETSKAKVSYKEYTVLDDEGSDAQPEFKVRYLDGWKAKVWMAVIAVVILLILVLIVHVVAALFPALIVIGVIVWVVKKIRS